MHGAFSRRFMGAHNTNLPSFCGDFGSLVVVGLQTLSFAASQLFKPVVSNPIVTFPCRKLPTTLLMTEKQLAFPYEGSQSSLKTEPKPLGLVLSSEGSI